MACWQNPTVFILLALTGFQHLLFVRPSAVAERAVIDLSSNVDGLEDSLTYPKQTSWNLPPWKLSEPNLLRLLYENWRLSEQKPGNFDADWLRLLDRFAHWRANKPAAAQKTDMKYLNQMIRYSPKGSPFTMERFGALRPISAKLSMAPNVNWIPESDWGDEDVMGNDFLTTSKRDNYMSMCHFKICNLGRKRRITHVESPKWPA